jgi:hypothetical protein
MAFDENNFKAVFEKRYGAGSYEAGLSQARTIGKTKAQAEFAKQAFNDYVSKKKKESTKKTYNDALDYWNDPANKEALRAKGVYRTEQELRNDPRKRQEIKDAGFTIEDFIDGMYSAGTEGDSRSKREYDQKRKTQNFDVTPDYDEETGLPKNPIKIKKIKPDATALQSLVPLKPEKSKKEVKAPTVKKESKSKKKENTTLWDDVKALGKATVQGFNPFDDVSMEEAVKNYTNRNTSNTFDEIARGSNRTVDAASWGAMSNLDKKYNQRDPYYLSERKFGEGGGADMISTGLGYLVPSGGAYKALNASKLGKGLTEMGSQSVGKRLLAEATKGGVIGGGMAGAEVGIREALNPNDYTAKENTKHILGGTALGMVADPLLYGAGKVFQKGFQTAADRTMQNLLPNQESVQQALLNGAKSVQGEQALPRAGGIQNPGVMQNLLPRGNDIANPNYVPSLTPTIKPQVTVPKFGTPLEEALANPKMDVPVTQPKAPQQAPIEQPIQNQTQPVIKPEAPIEQPIPKQEPVVTQQETPIQAPTTAPKKPNERSFYSTVQNPEKLSPELRQRLEEFDKTYKPMSNQEVVDYANEYVKNDIEKAYQFVKNANKFDPRHITVGHRLIDELQKSGQYDKALDVVERLAEQGTKAGQSIQSFSIYNRLSAEGQLLRAQRRVNKINENIADPNKQVKLTEQTIQDITHTADSIKHLVSTNEQANNVIKIMDNLKKGNQPTDAELNVVRSFVSDAKKFVGDLDPKTTPPKVKPVKDVRTRDKVVDFMSRQEEAALQRIQARRNRANSLPLDEYADYVLVGAAKIAKGTVKFADFSEQMIKDIGEHIEPYIQSIYNKAVETFNLQSESMTRSRLSEVEKITNKALKDKNLSEDEADTIRAFAERVGKMTGDAKLENSMELQSILQALERPTFGQTLSTTQTIAQLLNPKTIVRNAIGNEMFYRVEQMTKLLATPVDIVRSKITGGDRTIVFLWRDQGQYWKNFMTGAKAGWKGVNPMGLQTQYDLGPSAFSKYKIVNGKQELTTMSKFNPLRFLEKTLGASLRSFDNAGYMRAYNSTLRELSTLKAINEGLKGQAKKDAIEQYIREADENMIQIADQYGKYATFQDNTALAKALTKTKKGMNKVSTLGLTDEFGLGDLVLKYPKTPGNLVMRALEYSPAGVVRSAHLIKEMAKTKSPQATREFYLSLTRAITGTAGFSALGYFLADKGILTSKGNSDYELSSLERLAGKQPNSVNFSALVRFIRSGFDPKKAGTKKGDTFYSYDWAQPISIAVALGTGVNQSKKESGELGLVDGAKGALDSGVNTVIQSSVLKGVNDFLANYPGRTMSDRLGDAAKGALGSFVPTLSNQIKQLNNNTARTTYAPSFSEESMNRVKNRIPGLDSQLPPSYDTLGNKRETFQNGSNNLYNVLLNPSFVSQYDPSPEAKFLLDFINETGDKRLAPRTADKKIDGTPLTGEQYAELQRLIGQETQKGLKNLLPKLKGNPDTAEVGKEIYDLLNAAGKKGKGEIRSQLYTKEQLNEAMKNFGLSEAVIKQRLGKGWTLSRALTTPLGKK